MRILPLLFLFFFITPVMAQELSPLEAEVFQYANRFPQSAYDHFIEKIEAGASTPDQAIYLYGMGIAHEKLGNIDEAIMDYMSAEILGYERAKEDIERLKK